MVCRMAANVGNVFPFSLQLWSTIFLMNAALVLESQPPGGNFAARELLVGDA